MNPKAKQSGKRNKKELTPRDLMKIEIAKELGLWEQIEREGWASLTNEACGRVGGIMNKRLKQIKETSL